MLHSLVVGCPIYIYYLRLLGTEVIKFPQIRFPSYHHNTCRFFVTLPIFQWLWVHWFLTRLLKFFSSALRNKTIIYYIRFYPSSAPPSFLSGNTIMPGFFIFCSRSQGWQSGKEAVFYFRLKVKDQNSYYHVIESFHLNISVHTIYTLIRFLMH